MCLPAIHLASDEGDSLRAWLATGTGHTARITYHAEDAALPFLTANEKMWESFEPQLRARLSELDEATTIADRVRGALLELLPGGSTSVKETASKLAVG